MRASSKPSYPTVRCSFCGRGTDAVDKMITGPSVHICSHCVEMCNEILREDRASAPPAGQNGSFPTPQQMKEYMDQFIVGQDQAKRGVAVAAYNHFKRVQSRTRDDADGVEIEKSNILLIGPTGTGKTLIAQVLARMLKVPFTIVDATVFTEAGYVGEDVENMLVRLLQAAGNDIAKAEKGIIYVDEIDKIARKTPNPSITRDVSGEGVQQALLKILEGTMASIPPKGGRKHPEQNLVQLNTRDILFICGGAFGALEDVIEKRVDQSRMGFNAQVRSRAQHRIGEIFSQVEPDDLIQYGMIPELVGRLPAVFALNDLDEEALLKILTEPRSSLVKQYQKLFASEGVRLTFARDALREVVKIAQDKKTGARGLRSVLESVLMPVMYELPSRNDVSECLVTREVIRKEVPPVYGLKKDKQQKIA